MWERKEANSFDVTTGHAQTMPSCHVLDYSWGEHLHLQSERERFVLLSLMVRSVDLGCLAY